MPYNPRKLSGEQLTAGQKILTLFHSIISWVVLLAHMQSGKTDTFLYVAAEMLRTRKVKKVIIICGNSEKELKKQIEKDVSKFLKKYKRELGDNDLDEDEIDDIITLLEDNIKIRYGCDLDEKHDDISSGDIKDTLIIFDESHYAASKVNRPNKFLERMGLSATGNPTCLDRPRNNFVLSVSATPYAEMSDLHHESQHKEVVRLIPGAGYRSVGYYLRNNKIFGFKSWSKMLSACFKKFAGQPKYSIVRVSGNSKMEEAKQIATENGWAYKVFDSESVAIAKKTHDSNMILSLNELENAPSQNTVIFIRGMCRMAKVLPKEHIAFVFETSKKSKTDCLVQSLLGRVCGYHSYDIEIYIHENILNKTTADGTTELEKFVELMDKGNMASIPCLAAHIVPVSTRDGVKDLSLVVLSGFSEDRADPDYSEFGKERITQYVLDSINSGDNIMHNQNGPKHNADLRRQLNAPGTKFVIHCLEKKNKTVNPTFKNVPGLSAGILAGEYGKNAIRSEPGCGLNASQKEQVNIWVFTTNKFANIGFPIGTIIIQAAAKFSETGESIVPKTTGKEAYSRRQEDETEVISNGSCALNISPSTTNSVKDMKLAISELVSMSLQQHGAVMMDRCITSNQDGSSAAEWQGILVNASVYTALQKGGSIYTHIKSTYNLTIKTIAKSGPAPKELKNTGMKRLCKISW